MKVFRLKAKRINKLPATVRLPKEFLRVNTVEKGDVIVLYLSETGELIIKKDIPHGLIMSGIEKTGQVERMLGIVEML